ncbi:hypothetical protein NOK12_14390 [Nocardioides sp. OK12]|uniref:Sulfotransferase family protein n=1 Tax=Nocardioides marinisabuli TaxID=419476 RepID=A0A7Y9F4Q7_9ACTN|nr:MULTISPECIES: hypothetical protein [Nocardioides]NYD59433.1 hypothetical protein [Nocardioides marinisabuli]GHJ58921.1 hypothetical protein NOK12_14390 [Nocardioides sp. OK12]
MIAAPKYGFVVLAVPKSGSTALEAAFAKHAQLVTSGPHSLKHVGVQGFERDIAPLLDEHGYPRTGYEVAALVRDPVSWMSSWWRYRSRPGIVGTATYTGEMSFDEFVGRVSTGEIDLPSQSSYVTGPDGAPGVDRLYRYEDLDDFLAWLHECLGPKKARKSQLKQRNVSPERQHEVSAATRDLVEEVYAADVALHRDVATGRLTGR